MAKPNTYPMQSMAVVDDVVRFVENPIVTEILRNSGYDLNGITAKYHDNQPALSQFMQLIGYSVGGYCDLFCASTAEKRKAQAMLH
jgi:hypothetical protein